MRPFTEVLADLHGSVPADMTERLTEVVTAVVATRKAGDVTLKMSIKPNGDNSVQIVTEVKSKVPLPEKPKTVMFVDQNAGLRRDNPNQAKLDLRPVPGADKSDLRKVPEPEKAREPEPASA